MKVNTKLMAALSSLAVSHGRNVLSSIEIAILRSTDSSVDPLDDKYVHEILFEISNAPGAITYLARRLSTRLSSTRDAGVALKSLLLLHRLIRGGDRYFEQDLRNLWSSGDLHIDVSWMSTSEFAVSYARFLEERMDWIINQAGKLEPQGTEQSVIYRVSKCQTFLDRIMECLPMDNSDDMIRSAMSIVLKESFRVYESLCEYMETVSISSSVDIFRKACEQSNDLRKYYECCKKIMVGKNLEYPLVKAFGDVSLVSDTGSPFSEGMETRISTVWVDFDDEEEKLLNSITECESSVKGKAMELL